MKRARIEVRDKKGIYDAVVEGLKVDIKDLGIRTVKGVGYVQVYNIYGNFTKKQLKKIAENIFDNYLLAFGGPDGVLIPYDRFRRTTLEDSILKDIFLKLLEKYKVVIISNQRYYDDPRTKELGLQSRLINYIPPHLRKNLTLYTSAGTFKIGFDEEGREIICKRNPDTLLLEIASEEAAETYDAEKICSVLKVGPIETRQAFIDALIDDKIATSEMTARRMIDWVVRRGSVNMFKDGKKNVYALETKYALQCKGLWPTCDS